MACGFLGSTKRQTDIQKYLPADSKIHELNAAVGKIFTETLYTKYGNTALEYLKKRGITDEIIWRFGLGYASNGKHARVELEKMGFSEEELIASGIFKRNEDGSLWFRFSGRVMFEIGGVGEANAREALRLAAYKLPIRTRVIAKEGKGE